MCYFLNFFKYRKNTQIASYDSNDDLTSPFDVDQLSLIEKEEEFLNSMGYKLLTEGEIKGSKKYKQISLSDTSTSNQSSSKSPLKMVFKKKSDTITTVSSTSLTPEAPLPASLSKVSKRKEFAKDSGITTESFTSPSQVYTRNKTLQLMALS